MSLAETARKMVGTLWRHQGRKPGVELDCAGLVVTSLQLLGYPVIDLSGYSRFPHAGRLINIMDEQDYLYRVPRSQIKKDDVLVLRFRREPTHLAICGGNTIIHAYEKAGQVCEHIIDSAWRNSIYCAYRLKS